MIKVAYIVSTLKRSGPSNQLFNILKYLYRTDFEPIIITLSKEPKESLKKQFESLNIQISSLNLSRVKSLLWGKRILLRKINNLNPDIIQTQGIRADSMAISIFPEYPVIMVIRCYPFIDYPLRYGRITGKIIAMFHQSVINKSKIPIGCSKSVASELASRRGIPVKYIQNGIDNDLFNKISEKEKKLKREQHELPRDKGIIIYTGSLNSRKDVKTLLLAFKRFNIHNKYILIILGKGSEKDKLEVLAGKDNSILFVGFKYNILEYLLISDYFISSSTGEGLPNSVVEAMACGLPVVLSDIPPHRELFEKLPDYKYFFPVGDIEKASLCLYRIVDDNYQNLSKEVAKLIDTDFNARTMSLEYQDLYRQILSDK